MGAEGDIVLVTILIDSYNYATYLQLAIDSALAQTYQPVEVLVVDDGSTDDSRTILAGYGSHIRTVLKDNGGQASAFRTGFQHARGDVVMLLDADDTLAPDTAARVVDILRSDPCCVRVQYRLRVVDPAGRPTGDLMPPKRVRLPEGDVRRLASRVRGFHCVPSSGNAYRRAALNHVPAAPEIAFRTSTDRWVGDLLAHVGSVHELPGIGGTYRIHGRNFTVRETPDAAYFAASLERRSLLHAAAQDVARSVGAPELPPRADEMRDASLRSWQLAAYKLGQPMSRPEQARLLIRGVSDTLRQPDKLWRTRLLHTAWFLTLAATPRGNIAARLIRRRYTRRY